MFHFMVQTGLHLDCGGKKMTSPEYNNPNSANNLGPGVFFETKDYANLFQRTLIMVIDLAVLLAVAAIIGWLWPWYNYEIEEFHPAFFIVILTLSYIYLSILKPSKYRTLGYIATGVKIVDLKGEKPAFLTMTARFVFLLFGPLAMIVDILWLTGEPTRQTLRDKYVGTYVIKKNARPIGKGNQRYVSLNFMGWNLMLREVQK